jgi:hypothetical protein
MLSNYSVQEVYGMGTWIARGSSEAELPSSPTFENKIKPRPGKHNGNKIDRVELPLSDSSLR